MVKPLSRSEGQKLSLSKARFFSRKMLRKFPNFLSLYCGSEKIPQNSRQTSRKISFPKIILKKSPTSFCRSAGRRKTFSRNYDEIRNFTPIYSECFLALDLTSAYLLLAKNSVARHNISQMALQRCNVNFLAQFLG